MNALARLAVAVADANAAVPLVAVSGVVTDVASSSYRVEGLSRFLGLGDIVALDGAGGDAIGAVVRIDRGAATVKPYGSEIGARLKELKPLVDTLSGRGRATVAHT